MTMVMVNEDLDAARRNRDRIRLAQETEDKEVFGLQLLQNNLGEVLNDYSAMAVVDIEQKWGVYRGCFYNFKNKVEANGVIFPLAFADQVVEKGKPISKALEDYEPSISREEFFVALAQVAKPVKERPPEGSTRGVYKKGKYLDEHRDEILADRLSFGLRSTLKKWGINSSTWRYTEKRWRQQGYSVPDIKGVEGHRGGGHEQKGKTIPIEEVGQVSSLAGTKAEMLVPDNSLPQNEGAKVSKIRKLLRWLVSEGIEPSYEMADELLTRYLKEEPIETTRELVGNKAFDVVALRKGMVRVYLEELLESMPEFNKTREGEYQCEKNEKNTNS